MTTRQPRGITFQIGAVFLLFALGLLGGVGLFAYTTGRATLLEVTFADLRARALEKAAALDAWADEQQADLTAAAASLELRDMAADLLAAHPGTRQAQGLHDHLVEYLQSHTHGGQRFLTLLLLRADSGKVLVSTDWRDEGKYKEDRPFFVQGLQGPFTQDLYISLEWRGPAMTVAAPVLAADGRPLAVLAGYLNLVRLEGMIGLRPGTRQSDDAYLVNASSLFVTQPRLLSNPGVLRRGVHTPAIRRCLAGEGGEYVAEDYRGVPVVAAYRWLPRRRLCLVATIDQAEAFGPVRAFGQTILAGGGLLLLMAAAVAVWAGRAITRPILALQKGAARVARGEREVRLPETSQNELGELAREFNRMAASVTEREEALRVSEVQFRTAFENANSGMCLVDLGGRLLRVNRKMCEIFGYAKDELERMTVNSLTAPEDLALSAAFIEKATAGVTDTALFEKRYVRKDGRIVWGQVASSLVRDAQGRPAYFISQVQDITARTQAEVEIRHLTERISLATRAAHMGIWDWDVAKNHLVWDEQMYVLYGQRRDTFSGAYEAWINGLHPDDRASSDAVSRDALCGKGEYDTEFRVVWPDGTVRVLAAKGEVFRDAAGSPLRMVGVNYDITARKEAADALRAALAEQEALLKEVHHRVKNNLQVVASLLNLQASRAADPEARAVLRDTQSRVRAMALLHETLYRSETLARVPADRYVQSLCAYLRRAADSPAGITLQAQVADVALSLDQAVPVGLILNELVTNALKHAFPTGGPGTITVTLERVPPRHLRLQVADTGVGCPPWAERAKDTTLGLQLVHRLAGQLDGTLVLRREGGAVWSVDFPLPEGAEALSSPAPPAARSGEEPAGVG